MPTRAKLVLLMSAVVATGVATAVAATTSPSPQPYQAHTRHNGRSAAHFLADYDLNHDGKVTKDELNKALSKRFAQASSGGQSISSMQYADFSRKEHCDRAAQYFRRADWNGDGKLSLDEYMAPLHAKFADRDRTGTGVIDCSRRAGANSFGSKGSPHRRTSVARGMCPSNDFNQDGKVTRAEYDKVNAQKFSQAAHGAKVMTFEQFLADGGSRAPGLSGHIFERLDTNHDGKLTLTEFAASQQKQFARLDKNKDGVVTREELATPQSRGNGGRRYSAAP